MIYHMHNILGLARTGFENARPPEQVYKAVFIAARIYAGNDMDTFKTLHQMGRDYIDELYTEV